MKFGVLQNLMHKPLQKFFLNKFICFNMFKSILHFSTNLNIDSKFLMKKTALIYT